MAEPLEQAVQAHQRVSIVIAEDDPSMRGMLTCMVEALGHEARPQADGAAALAAIAGRPPDLVLSDVNMPGMDGFELCRRLKADPATRLIPIVLVTGMGDEFRLRGIEAGADDFLSKPVEFGDLQVRLRAFLRMKAFTDELDSAEAILLTLAETIEAKDPYTSGHCRRLAGLSVAMGHRLRLGAEDLTALRRAGYLHDLGKVAVPEAILLKPAPLSPAERRLMERHPVIGEEICRPLRSLAPVLPIIRHHHEHPDGSGYPDGLRRGEVPLLARVLRTADIYDALVTDRPYRQAMPPEAAFRLLEREQQAGRGDPETLRALRDVLREQAGRAPGEAVAAAATREPA
ncbi:MAG: HD-GYP domain-containing protein [Candidatus Methylomirabilales bacterium]